MNKTEKLKIRKALQIVESKICDIEDLIDEIIKNESYRTLGTSQKTTEDPLMKYAYVQSDNYENEYKTNIEQIDKLNNVRKNIVDLISHYLYRNRDAFYHIFFNKENLQDLFVIYFSIDNMSKFGRILEAIYKASIFSYIRDFKTKEDVLAIEVDNPADSSKPYKLKEILETLLKIKEELIKIQKDNAFTVFLSWQSDDQYKNRDIIKASIKNAIDGSRYVYDESTANEPGSPNIPETIFKKIDDALLFVADITPVTSNRRRKIPNPNVMLEAGYALSTLGSAYILFVYDESKCKKEKLPFDINQRRIYGFDSKNDPKEETRKLSKYLKETVLPNYN